MAFEDGKFHDDKIEPFLNEISSLLPEDRGVIRRRDFLKLAGAFGATSALAILAASVRHGNAQTKEQVILRLDWLAGGYHAPFYSANAQGYWDKRGVSVDIRPGTGSGDVAKLVGLERDEFGLVDCATMIKSRTMGIPVKMIGLHYGKSAMGYIHKTKSGIKEPKDMEGKSLALTAGAANAVLTPPFFKKNNVDINKVKINYTPAASYVPLLLEDKIDSAGIYPVLYLPPLKAKGWEEGKNLNVIRFSDPKYGFENLMGQGFVTSDTLIKKKPALVKNFVPPLYEGILFAMKNPDEAAASLLKAYPELDKMVQKEILIGSFELIPTKEASEHTLGWMSKEKWAWMQELLHEIGQIDKKLPVEEYFTNEFLAGPPYKG